MEILIEVFLPLSLAVIMLSLGVGLKPADFKRVATHKKAFFTGLFGQMVLIPVFAFIVVITFGFTGAIAAGIMLLSFCPGGVTSNILARMAHGDVALSVSLTAVMSLLSMLTVPVLVSWAVMRFMTSDVPDVSVTSISLAMFLITALPVLIGMGIRLAASTFADRIEPVMHKVSVILFSIIILAAIATNWGIFVENVAFVGPALILLIIATLLGGLILARVAGLNWAERKTISLEVGVQNGTLGITLAPIITGVTTGIPEMALPSAIYSALTYAIVLPYIFWLRRR